MKMQALQRAAQTPCWNGVPPIMGTSFYPISRLELLLTTSLTGSVSGSKFCGIGGEAGRVPAGQCRVLQRVSALVPASLRDVEVGAG